MSIDPNSISRLDRPLADLDADLKALATRRSCQVLAEAAARTLSPSDRLACANSAWLLTHPEACSTSADYPNWQPGRAS